MGFSVLKHLADDAVGLSAAIARSVPERTRLLELLVLEGIEQERLRYESISGLIRRLHLPLVSRLE